MDPRTFEYLSCLFPPEIAVIIDDQLIIAYRKENAEKCANLIEGHVTHDHMSSIKVDGIVKMSFWICECNEVVSCKILGNHRVIVTHAICDYDNWEAHALNPENTIINNRLVRIAF
nr:hypothetical protein K-LCC10_0255 [Kaumoebavirus]